MKNVKNTLAIFNKIFEAQQLLDSLPPPSPLYKATEDTASQFRARRKRAQDALDEAQELIEKLNAELQGGAA